MDVNELLKQWNESAKAKEESERKFCSYLETDIVKCELTDLAALKKILSAQTFKALEEMVALSKKENADFEEWFHANNEKVMG